MSIPKAIAPVIADSGAVIGFGTIDTAAIPTANTARPEPTAVITFFPYGSVLFKLLEVVTVLITDINDVPTAMIAVIRLCLFLDSEKKNYSSGTQSGQKRAFTHLLQHLHPVNLCIFVQNLYDRKMLKSILSIITILIVHTHHIWRQLRPHRSS